VLSLSEASKLFDVDVEIFGRSELYRTVEHIVVLDGKIKFVSVDSMDYTFGLYSFNNYRRK
jgi:hypothetical protein